MGKRVDESWIPFSPFSFIPRFLPREELERGGREGGGSVNHFVGFSFLLHLWERGRRGWVGGFDLEWAGGWEGALIRKICLMDLLRRWRRLFQHAVRWREIEGKRRHFSDFNSPSPHWRRKTIRAGREGGRGGELHTKNEEAQKAFL